MNRETFSRSLVLCLTVALLSLGGVAARCESLFGLSDLSSAQESQLFTQVDRYGLLTAMLNFCGHPPNLVIQLTPIAQGCVDPASFNTVLSRYTAAVVANSGAYNCAGLDATHLNEFEEKIAGVISSLKNACRIRSFKGISFPKIDQP